MSRADDAAKERAVLEQDLAAYERARLRVEPPELDPNPRSWRSRCAGTRDGLHQRARVEADGCWRCLFCWKTFNPPAAFAGVAWTLCQARIDLKHPLGVQRGRGRTPVFVYECPSCKSIQKRPVKTWVANRQPLPENGTMVCGAQIPAVTTAVSGF